MPSGETLIRAARAHELPELEHIVRAAFAAQFGLPAPEAFGDRALIAPRWHSDPESVIVAELDGQIVGSNVVTLWGRFGWFGPLTVRPEFWNRRIAQALMTPTMERFAAHGTSAEALYTFSSSPKHVALYQRYGFRPRRLTAIFGHEPQPGPIPFARFSALDATARARALTEMRALADALFPGLDPTAEIAAVADQCIGETLLRAGAGGAVEAFAVCHHGVGSEAGSRGLSVKFAASTSRPAFGALLEALPALAAEMGAERLDVAINAAREEAYDAALAAGYRIALLGVAMVRGGTVYDRPSDLVIEDHR